MYIYIYIYIHTEAVWPEYKYTPRVCIPTYTYINIYIYIYQGFLKSGNLGTGFPATWPKWLRETTKVAARIIEWLRKS